MNKLNKLSLSAAIFVCTFAAALTLVSRRFLVPLLFPNPVVDQKVATALSPADSGVYGELFKGDSLYQVEILAGTDTVWQYPLAGFPQREADIARQGTFLGRPGGDRKIRRNAPDRRV